MRNIALKIAYDGTGYSGWQKQKNACTVQQSIEKALTHVLNEEISISGAGRTDSGVHALSQFAAFYTDKQIPLEALKKAVNNVLPADIRLLAAYDMPHDFHPRKSEHQKTYAYSVALSEPNLFAGKYCFYAPEILDLEGMAKAAEYFIGEHDFRNFSVTGSDVKTTVRRIYGITMEKIEAKESSCAWQNTPQMLVIRITGGGFLYKMVRLMTARLLEIGRGEQRPEYIAELLAAPSCKQIPPLPPQGLILENIKYAEYPQI